MQGQVRLPAGFLVYVPPGVARGAVCLAGFWSNCPLARAIACGLLRGVAVLAASVPVANAGRRSGRPRYTAARREYRPNLRLAAKTGRASGRERVCQYV